MKNLLKPSVTKIVFTLIITFLISITFYFYPLISFFGIITDSLCLPELGNNLSNPSSLYDAWITSFNLFNPCPPATYLSSLVQQIVKINIIASLILFAVLAYIISCTLIFSYKNFKTKKKLPINQKILFGITIAVIIFLFVLLGGQILLYYPHMIFS